MEQPKPANSAFIERALKAVEMAERTTEVDLRDHYMKAAQVYATCAIADRIDLIRYEGLTTMRAET